MRGHPSEKRGSRLHVGLNERLDRCGRIVGDDGEAESAGTHIDIFGVLEAWVSLAAVYCRGPMGSVSV
jgi:hypothetical protein